MGHTRDASWRGGRYGSREGYASCALRAVDDGYEPTGIVAREGQRRGRRAASILLVGKPVPASMHNGPDSVAGAADAIGAGKARVWLKVLRKALKVPGARVDRDAYLRRELSKRVGPELAERAVRHGAGKRRDLARPRSRWSPSPR